MKKLLIFLFSIICCLIFTENAKAGQQVELDAIMDSEDDLRQIRELEDEIINQLNGVRSTKGQSELPEGFKPDYSKAYKIYIDTDIFLLSSDSSAEIMNNLKAGKYVWSLFVQYENNYYTVDISKGQPLRQEIANLLTEEEINKIKAEEGKWIVSCVSVLDYDMSYQVKIADALKNTKYDCGDLEFVLCGGLKYIHNPVAVVMYNGNAELIIPLYKLTVNGTDDEKARAMPEGAGESDNVYLYDSIKQAVNRMELKENNDEVIVGSGGIIDLSDSKNESGAAGIGKNVFSIYIYTVAGIVCLVLLVSCAVFVGRRAKKRKH